MKLSGNSKKSAAAPRTTAAPRDAAVPRGAAPTNRRPNQKSEKIEDPRAARAAMKKKRGRRARRIGGSILLVCIALSAVLYSLYKVGVRPPDPKPRTTVTSGEGDGEPIITNAPAGSNDRISKYIYTFVIVGEDRVSKSTDTIMVANFDAVNHTLNIVNIPRDTLVNVKWSTKKANTLYANGGMDGVIEGLSKILGFPVDYYVHIDLEAFKKLVDAVDGVEFDVPKDMDYDDPVQDLHIHLKKGLQTLDGEHAMQLVRCRSVYSTADIGRIETQQAFLKAAMEQVLKNRDRLNIKELADIFLTNVKTDLDIGELGWLAREFLKMDSTGISLQTLPADYWDTVNGQSYVTIYVNEWLQLLNDKINPFKEDIKLEDLSILTRNSSGKIYSTNGVYAGKQTWGNGSAGSSGGSAKPSPSPEETTPSPSPSPSASAGADASPSPETSTSPSPATSPETGGTSPSPSTAPSPEPSAVTESPSPDPAPDPSPSEDTD